MDMDLVHLEAILKAKGNSAGRLTHHFTDPLHPILEPTTQKTANKEVDQLTPSVFILHPKPQSTKPHQSSVKQRLEPLLPTPPLSAATINLFQSQHLAKSCPVITKIPFLKHKYLNPKTTTENTTSTKQTPTTSPKALSVDSWTTILPKKTENNLNKLKKMELKEFIKLRLLQLKKGARCFNCLSKGHLCSSCTAPVKCLVCNTAGHNLRSCNLLHNSSNEDFSAGQLLSPLASPQVPTQPMHTDKPPPQQQHESEGSGDFRVSQECCIVPDNTVSGPVTGRTGEIISSSQCQNGRVQLREHWSQMHMQITGDFSWGQGSLLLAANKDSHAEPFFSVLLLTVPFAVQQNSHFRLLRSFPSLLGKFWTTTFIEGENHVTDQDPSSNQLVLYNGKPNNTLDSEPLHPPGFENNLGLFNSFPLGPVQPTISSQPTRRSPRLLSKNNGPYVSALGKAQQLAHGAPTNQKKKTKRLMVKPDLLFMKESGPINRVQARTVLLEAGFELTEDIISNLTTAGIVPLPR